jgi:hypothetical protein
MLSTIRSALTSWRQHGQRAYAYHDARERLDPDAKRTYGRMWIARAPDGAVKAAGWDCGETRRAARRWLGYGLRMELIPRSIVDQALASDPRRVFETTEPLTPALEPTEAEAALQQS